MARSTKKESTETEIELQQESPTSEDSAPETIEVPVDETPAPEVKPVPEVTVDDDGVIQIP